MYHFEYFKIIFFVFNNIGVCVCACVHTRAYLRVIKIESEEEKRCMIILESNWISL